MMNLNFEYASDFNQSSPIHPATFPDMEDVYENFYGKKIRDDELGDTKQYRLAITLFKQLITFSNQRIMRCPSSTNTLKVEKHKASCLGKHLFHRIVQVLLSHEFLWKFRKSSLL